MDAIHVGCSDVPQLKKKFDLVQYLVYFQTMIKLNIHEAKTHLSKYLELVAKGETIVLCKRNIPIAEIRSIPQNRKSKRPLGLAKGKFQVPPEFFQPLPDKLTKSFYGEAS
jgi:antitoxin (DNA-binding transcriptional repressor) of toxin-antitoxin stability system